MERLPPPNEVGQPPKLEAVIEAMGLMDTKGHRDPSVRGFLMHHELGSTPNLGLQIIKLSVRLLKTRSRGWGWGMRMGGGGLCHKSHPRFHPSIHPIVGPSGPTRDRVYSNVDMRVCIYRVSFFQQNWGSTLYCPGWDPSWITRQAQIKPSEGALRRSPSLPDPLMEHE